jgi:hypothetical protein
LTSANPTSADLQQAVSLDMERLGDARLAQGDVAGALAEYQQSLVILQRLASMDPTNVPLRQGVGAVLAKLAAARTHAPTAARAS